MVLSRVIFKRLKAIQPLRLGLVLSHFKNFIFRNTLRETFKLCSLLVFFSHSSCFSLKRKEIQMQN